MSNQSNRPNIADLVSVARDDTQIGPEFIEDLFALREVCKNEAVQGSIEHLTEYLNITLILKNILTPGSKSVNIAGQDPDFIHSSKVKRYEN